MEPAETRRAVRTAMAMARQSGLDVDEAVTVHDSDRVVVRLLPCDVLVRVAPVSDRAEAELEVEVARHLTAVGAPVAELDPRIADHLRTGSGFVVSFWTYYETTARLVGPTDYAGALVRHHAALREVDLAVPHVTERIAGALRLLRDEVRTPELPGPDRQFLRDQLDVVTTALAGGASAEQLLHGEPHPGNVLATLRGPLFVDLATCCRGPVEFDLAHAPDAVAMHYPGVDQGLLRLCRAADWALFATWRWRSDDRFPGRRHWRVEGLRRARAGSTTT